MDTRTLEQVIMDASGKSAEAKGYSAVVGCDSAEARIIADAVRKWMLDTPGAVFHDRIKELEAEVERLKAMTYLPSNEAIDKAAKYDALRERFPFLPGEEFYATVSSKRLILNVGDPIPELIIYKRTVNLVGVNGVLDTKDNTWNWDECHPTAEACKAAILVEE